MKIAISAEGPGLDHGLDPRFGRAAYFVLYDTLTQQGTSHDNHAGRQSRQGAGIQAAETVSQMGAELVITGHCGPKAFQALQAAKIPVIVGAKGQLHAVLASYLKGEMKIASQADVGEGG